MEHIKGLLLYICIGRKSVIIVLSQLLVSCYYHHSGRQVLIVRSIMKTIQVYRANQE